MNTLNMNEDNLLNLNSINKPVYYLISQDFYGSELYDVLNKRRAIILDEELNENSNLFLIKAHLPIVES